MEEEEIYDEGISPVKPSGLSALKNKFENPGSGTSKPATVSKPGIPSKSGNIASKFGGVATSGYKPPSVTGFIKPVVESANKINTDKSNENEETNKDKQTTNPPSLTKRNSKVNIPAAFQTGNAPPPLDKPNTAVKPVPKWKQKQDDSNNNNNKETVANSNVSKESNGNTETMLNKDSKPNDLPKKPLPSPSYSGNVKEKANLLFGGVSPSELKLNLKPVPNRFQETKTQEKPGASVKPIVPKRSVGDAGTSTVELRAKFVQPINAKRKSVKSIVRGKDNRKFHKVELDNIKSEKEAPTKPDKLDTEVDWDKLENDFKDLLKDLETAKSGIEEFEEEEYDDIANVLRKDSRAISIIQPLTEEEEKEWEEHGFEGLKDSTDSLPPPPAGVIPNKQQAKRRTIRKEFLEPQEEYDDVAILQQNGQDDGGEELYEPLPDEPLDEIPSHHKPGIVQNGTAEKPPPPSLDLIDKKDTKESEKERKRREKEEKEQSKKKEKEFKKKQDDLKHLMSKYKIDAESLTKSVGKGVIRKASKGGKKDIPVQQGDKVDVIRMVDNDKGKWLIRILNTDKVGYVDSTNVEIMEGSYARQNFLSSSSSVSSSVSMSEGDEEGETYEAVDGEEAPDAIEEEIYEECT